MVNPDRVETPVCEEPLVCPESVDFPVSLDPQETGYDYIDTCLFTIYNYYTHLNALIDTFKIR